MKIWTRAAVTAAGLLGCLVLGAPVLPTAQATLCGSVGGRHVDVTGCADPLSYLNDVPPPAAPPPPPPPPAWVPGQNVDVCANVGRRISVSGCI